MKVRSLPFPRFINKQIHTHMNFILRTVITNNDTKKSSQHNRVIGSDYSLIFREEDYDSFCEMYRKEFEKPHVADMDETSDSLSQNTYGFIIIDNGSIALPLYKNQYNYIMTESGNTFSNISYK